LGDGPPTLVRLLPYHAPSEHTGGIRFLPRQEPCRCRISHDLSLNHSIRSRPMPLAMRWPCCQPSLISQTTRECIGKHRTCTAVSLGQGSHGCVSDLSLNPLTVAWTDWASCICRYARPAHRRGFHAR
jgi:hypothetical protein